jgi:isocitrate dehydrogenase (NAD+)
MLRHLGHPAAAGRVEEALRSVIAEGRRVTYDLGGDAGTSEFADAIVERLATAAAAAG